MLRNGDMLDFLDFEAVVSRSTGAKASRFCAYPRTNDRKTPCMIVGEAQLLYPLKGNTIIIMALRRRLNNGVENFWDVTYQICFADH